jgi:hypothetical protein
MMPGRSLSGKTSGRSMAPVASTTSLRAHLPQPLARHVRVGGGEMVGDALGEPDEVLRVVAERRRARQQRHASIAASVASAPRASRRRAAVDLAPISAAARRRTPPARRTGSPRAAGPGRGERRREAGRAGADHQHVAMA